MKISKDHTIMNKIQGISHSRKLVHFLQPKDLSMMMVKKILDQLILQ